MPNSSLIPESGSTGPSGLICVSIMADADADASQAEVVAAVKRAEQHADVIEIRLDSMANLEVPSLIKSTNRPLLFTNRPDWEGGSFSGNEEERLVPLLEAVRHGAAYVDIELKTALPLRQQILDRVSGTRSSLIISWHDFSRTPSSEELLRIFQDQYESGARIGKIVTMAHDFRDVLRVLHLQIQAAAQDFPLIAFCMGRAGMISRLATLELGGYMTYTAPDNGKKAAPGQLPVSMIRDIVEQLKSRRGS